MLLKKFIKRLIQTSSTIIRHPLFCVRLMSCGCKKFYVGHRLDARRIRYLNVKNNIYIGNDARLLFIDEYYGEKLNPVLNIGFGVDIENRFSCLCAAPITIGDGALIASDVLITSENHGIDPEKYEKYSLQPLDVRPVVIGNGCWIGEKASIMPGVTLGERCVVAAGAVVTHSFPAYTMIAGIPAKSIKEYNFKTKTWERVNI